MEQKDTKRLAKLKLDDATVDAQWAMFADEYNMPDDRELNSSEDPTSQGFKALKSAWCRMIRAGLIEIVSDASDGVVVKQFLAHRVEGLSGEPQCLTWKAPTVSIISAARMGTKSSEETPSIQQWLKYAAAATGVSEGLLIQLKGGDQSRMGQIAQLFILA